MTTTEEIRKLITSKINDAEVHVFDPNSDGQHFQALVISASFEGMPLVKQHQTVLRCLTEAFDGAVHAMQLKTFTPEKWQESKSEYNV